MKQNCGFVSQFQDRDDPFIPWEVCIRVPSMKCCRDVRWRCTLVVCAGGAVAIAEGQCQS